MLLHAAYLMPRFSIFQLIVLIDSLQFVAMKLLQVFQLLLVKKH